MQAQQQQQQHEAGEDDTDPTQQRERLKADLQVHNVNMSFTKIYLDDKALLRGFRIRKWVADQLWRMVDKVVDQSEGVDDDKQQQGQEEGEKEEEEEEDEVDAAVREEAAEMEKSMVEMGWAPGVDVPLAFGGSAKRERGEGRGKKSNNHIRFDGQDEEEGEGSSNNNKDSPRPLNSRKRPRPNSTERHMFFSADGADEEPEPPPAPSHTITAATGEVEATGAPPPKKYWMQRFRFFSQFDLGCRLDEEGWFSVTPERIARHIAERGQCDVVVDLMVGCGGNAIQFALTSHYVIAIDIDPVKLAHARHNAKIYGVEDRIEFILGNALTLLPRLGPLSDLIFLSPPWGGPEYLQEPVYSLERIQVGGGGGGGANGKGEEGEEGASMVGGKELLARVLAVCPNVAVLLPRNVDLKELVEVAGGRTCEVEENVLNYKVKTITVYFGDYFFPAPVSDWAQKKQQQKQKLKKQGQQARRRKRNNKKKKLAAAAVAGGGGGGGGEGGGAETAQS